MQKTAYFSNVHPGAEKEVLRYCKYKSESIVILSEMICAWFKISCQHVSILTKIQNKCSDFGLWSKFKRYNCQYMFIVCIKGHSFIHNISVGEKP